MQLIGAPKDLKSKINDVPSVQVSILLHLRGGFFTKHMPSGRNSVPVDFIRVENRHKVCHRSRKKVKQMIILIFFKNLSFQGFHPYFFFQNPFSSNIYSF